MSTLTKTISVYYRCEDSISAAVSREIYHILFGWPVCRHNLQS